MKKLFVLLLCFVLVFCASASADSSTANVVEMPYIAKMPDVMREGEYTGQIVNGLPHGFGVFVAVNDTGTQWHYIGEWVEGKMTGQGGQYWEHGQCYVGTFENNEFRCGHYRSNSGTHIWVDYNLNEHGCTSAIVYRPDGSKYVEYCYLPDTYKPHMATIYTKEGKVFFSGTVGEGFNISLIDLD